MARPKESWLAALPECDNFGFRWGNLIVQRATHDERYGRWLRIVTQTGWELDIRVTKGGKLRVGKPQIARQGESK
jgi:hypothetical protein